MYDPGTEEREVCTGTQLLGWGAAVTLTHRDTVHIEVSARRSLVTLDGHLQVDKLVTLNS